MGPALHRFHFRASNTLKSTLKAGFALALAFPAFSAPLNAGFIVMDKLGKPIVSALACLEEDNSQCAETNADGRATLAATVANRSMASLAGFSFSLQGGRLSLTSPVAQQARVARFDARGRALGPDLVLDLKAGANAVDLPQAKAGLFFFRVAIPGQSFTGKALALSGRGGSQSGSAGRSEGGPVMASQVSPRAAAGRVAALGKVAAANLHAVVISKTGYRSVTYRPRTDHDTGVIIRLAAATDSGIQYAGIIRAKVDAIDTANHSLNYTYLEAGCAGSSPIMIEKHSSLPFWVRDNKWYFPAGNCKGVALGKEGTGFFGAWKTLGLQDYPPGLVPVKCDPVKDSVVTGVLNLFFINEGGGWDIDLRADSMTIKIRRELCPGNQAVQDPAYYNGKEGRPLLARNTCKEVEFRNPSDEPGIYSFSRESDSLRGVFTYKDKTCPSYKASLIIDSGMPKNCPETGPGSLAADTTFQRCVINSGFMPPIP